VNRGGGIGKAGHVDEVPQVYAVANAGLREELTDLGDEVVMGGVGAEGEVDCTVQAVAGGWEDSAGSELVTETASRG
jgi:hypothetical protein